ncbi:MAG: ABC transporter ATP-binding protein [Fervidobacterium sp.]
MLNDKSAPILKVENLKFSYGDNFSIRNVTFSVSKGTFFGIIGPNGSGKTTLLSLIMKFLRPHEGRITVNGLDLKHLSPKLLAQNIAYIAQDFNPSYDFTVEEIVEMASIAHNRTFNKSFFDSVVDEEALEQSLEIVNLLEMRKRQFSTLSGGQQRRVLIARAFYQKTPIIVADELTNHLDIGQAIKVMDYLKSLTSMGKTVIGTFHDITLAAKYCDQIVVMKNGEIVKNGTPLEVINERVISELYGVNIKVLNHPDYNYPILVI